MTEDEFWQLVEIAQAGRAGYDGRDEIAKAVSRLLAAHEVASILDYQEHFDCAKRALYQWKYWAAGYIIGGGCSDDSFIDFRAGVISLGRDWYERFRADPDCLADHEEVRENARRGNNEAIFAESFNYAAGDAYENVSGSRDDFYHELEQRRLHRDAPDTDPDMGEDFDFDNNVEMHRRLPRLATLYGWATDGK